MSFVIERADLRDLDWITKIYNEAVIHSTATFDTEPKTREAQMEWFKKHGPSHPILVARPKDRARVGEGLGWASLSPYSDRCAYAQSAEVSIYVDTAARGKGAGNLLLKQLILEAQKLGLHSLISRITENNPVSVALHLRHGFTHAGTLKEVGEKFGKRLSVDFYQWIE